MLIRAAFLMLAALPAVAAELPLSACPAPELSPEAKRYELQGTTRLEITRGPFGQPAATRVASSSGWKLLDESALALAAKCSFDKAEKGLQPFSDTLTINCTIPAAELAPQAPLLQEESCRPTALFKRGASAKADDTLRVRLQVWDDGQVFTPKLEGSSGDAQIDKLAVAYVQSCRYTPAQKDGAPVRGTAVMALDLQRAAYDDAALRAVYLRVLPSLEARMAGKNDYKVAHILTKDEATARKAHAAIAGGAAFAEQAKLVSIDRGGKDGGALDWRASSAYVGPFAAALTSAKGQGLLPDVVKTEFGWHVIRIDGVRPTPVPTFVQLRATIKGYVLADQVAKFEELARAK